mgnify:CR=1 FL=1
MGYDGSVLRPPRSFAILSFSSLRTSHHETGPVLVSCYGGAYCFAPVVPYPSAPPFVNVRVKQYVRYSELMYSFLPSPPPRGVIQGGTGTVWRY